MWNPSDWHFNVYDRHVFTILFVYCLKSANNNNNNNNNNKLYNVLLLLLLLLYDMDVSCHKLFFLVLLLNQR